MMHKRNATITAAILAAIVTLVLMQFPRLYHGVVGFMYMPALLIDTTAAYLMHKESPPDAVGYTASIANSLAYIFVFLFVYVLILEFYLLRQVAQHLDAAKDNMTEKVDTRAALGNVGNALVDLEKRRRHHFLLQPDDSINLNDAPHLIAARAIAKPKRTRATEHVLKKLKARLALAGDTQANQKVEDLKKDAATFVQ